MKRVYEEEVDPDKAMARAEATASRHTMAWLFEFIPGRLYCGPLPSSKDDALSLVVTHRINRVVNLLPHTTKTTGSGLPGDTWYTCYWKTLPDNAKPVVVRDVKLFGPETGKNAPKDMCAWYVNAALNVVTPLLRAEPNAVFYVHHKLGYEEEAVVAFLVWAAVSPSTFPANVEHWIAEQHYERLLDDVEKRLLLRRALIMLKEKARATAGAGSMSKWLIKKPKP